MVLTILLAANGVDRPLPYLPHVIINGSFNQAMVNSRPDIGHKYHLLRLPAIARQSIRQRLNTFCIRLGSGDVALSTTGMENGPSETANADDNHTSSSSKTDARSPVSYDTLKPIEFGFLADGTIRGLKVSAIIYDPGPDLGHRSTRNRLGLLIPMIREIASSIKPILNRNMPQSFNGASIKRVAHAFGKQLNELNPKALGNEFLNVATSGIIGATAYYQRVLRSRQPMETRPRSFSI
ncbi:hypothetical protein I316_01235 [Kwoniella heveanensis BCC8398]|uniref:Uncharacterized protein n=1 Tax=Kwoniella heveanensis BCC8398 TaxID=1296120 RepID=A0A1B9H231_9TREE|nr:hypothetical protein I316_01235 [Kwoniella heveanensis BCC8398]